MTMQPITERLDGQAPSETDVMITRDGNKFLVRALTADGEEFVDDMFSGVVLMDDFHTRQTGFRRWPERNGAVLVDADWIDDDVLDEADNRGLIVRVL
jgi:hypothetical protein